ncbi:MAG: hypothetical protein ACC645_21100 [Pirellulales bacterium]
MTRTETPFPGLEIAQPPAELKKRTLDQVRLAMIRPPLPDMWTRIWSGRAVRLAWAASVLVLLAGHLAITVTSRGARHERAMALSIASADDDSELAEVVDLPYITALLPRIQAAVPESNDKPQEQKNSIAKENQS